MLLSQLSKNNYQKMTKLLRGQWKKAIAVFGGI
jgi:hypothetical protein